MHEIQIDWHSREEYERLRDLRDRHGLLWRGVLLEGAKNAESLDLLQALFELNPELANQNIPGEYEGMAPERVSLRSELREQTIDRSNSDHELGSRPSDEEETDTVSAEETRSSSGIGQSEIEQPDPEVESEHPRNRLYRRWDEQANDCRDRDPVRSAAFPPRVEDPQTGEVEPQGTGDPVDPYCDYDQYALEPNEGDIA